MNKKTDNLIRRLKDDSGLFLSISLGIFLFVLFFQPFSLINLDYNNGLVYVAGFGGIVLLALVIVRTLLPWLIGEDGTEDEKRQILPPVFRGFLILLLSGLGFEFYLRYVGSLNITFSISFKVFLVCLGPPVIAGVYDRIRTLRIQNDSLILEKKIIQKQVEKYEEDYLNKSVDFISENTKESFNILIADVAFVRSADNYVEIVYKEGDTFERRLIRNTLKNVEQQIRHYSNFMRCHRICLVNLHFVEKLIRINDNNWLVLKGYNEQLPVSRQYLLKLKEAL